MGGMGKFLEQERMPFCRRSGRRAEIAFDYGFDTRRVSLPMWSETGMTAANL